MEIIEFLQEISAGLIQFLPSLGEALVTTFQALFFEQNAENALVLNTLGNVTLSFFVVGLSFKALPGVLGWLRARWASRKSRRRSRRA